LAKKKRLKRERKRRDLSSGKKGGGFLGEKTWAGSTFVPKGKKGSVHMGEGERKLRRSKTRKGKRIH